MPKLGFEDDWRKMNPTRLVNRLVNLSELYDFTSYDPSDEEIEEYIKTGDPMDKAGAYAIQHPGFKPVEDLSDCYACVMGLPLCNLAVGLRKFGLQISEDLPQRCQELLKYNCPNLSNVLSQD